MRVTTGQLLRHYSPDLEVFRVLGATSCNTSGRIVGVGENVDLVDMARYVTHHTTYATVNFPSFVYIYSQECTWLLMQHSWLSLPRVVWVL